jgi:hypothetical protein
VLHVGGAIRERLASAAVTRTSLDIPGPTFEGGRRSITQSEDLLGDFVWNRVVLSHFRRDIYEYQGLLAFAFLRLVLCNKEIKFKDSYPPVLDLGDSRIA